MKKLVIIVGMHRSGTSLVSQICKCMGTYLGAENELMIASPANLDGYFENLEVVRINDDVLRFYNREWYSLETFELDYHSPWIKGVMERIKNCIRKLFEESDIVAIKDPRLSLLLPLWDKVLNELEIETSFIWVFRNPLEVMDSLRKRDGYSSRHALMLWCYYNFSILEFLKKKKYLLVNYRDVLESPQSIEEIGRFLNCMVDENLKQKLGCIIKNKYCHSTHSNQEVQNIGNKLLSGLYKSLLQKNERKLKVSGWRTFYMTATTNSNDGFIDYEVIENIKYLHDKRIIIYGAGNFGKKAAKMLQQLGFPYDFCDRDTRKQGTSLLGGEIYSVKQIEKEEKLLIVIAIESEIVRKEIEETLACIEGANFLSFFALEKAWKYVTKDYTTPVAKIEAISLWYEKLEWRGSSIKNACQAPVLVYQNGKVGSSTVARSLWNVGIENAHVHRFFFKNEMVGKLILGDNQTELINRLNVFQVQSADYLKSVKNEVKGKKIITLVREPIAVDLSTVFQWMGSGIADRYFAQELQQGKSFLKVVSELMEKIQDRLYDWFDEELKELCGINIFAHPFDKEKGYTLISENEVEVLLIKAEKLSGMASVIGDFVGSQEFKLINANVGETKEYTHIYKEVKKRLLLPRSYVEHYYKNNAYMDYFYSKEEQEEFWDKWARCIESE